TIETLIARWVRVLEVMTADPDVRLSSVDVVDGGERARLDLWSNREVLVSPVGPAVSVPVLFGEQVARVGDAVAVSFGDRSLTYRELDEASNRLAQLLVGRGVGAGQCVALVMPRSIEAITAIVGILKSGAAYVPIDPAVPDTRLEFVLTDAAPVAAITTTALTERLTGLAGRDLWVIDVEDPAITTQPTTAVTAPDPDDIAYIIY
ncbi:AMP-binding protein, partial [Mycobacterium montefiorense]|uniref:AMP-binding protein n=2 Tax=Mycobacterium montefiorense TaxID=154654 RepID=UPI0021C3D545